MIDELDAADVASEAVMARAGKAGPVLFVEGRGDKLWLEEFLAPGTTLIPTHGKDVAVEVLAILRGQGHSWAVALVDADFQRLEGQTPPLGVFWTDFHDADMVLFCSEALDRVLEEFGSEAKVAKHGGLASIRKTVLRAAAPFGYLRWLNERHQLSVDFDEIPLERAVIKCRLETKEKHLMKLAVSAAGSPDWDENDYFREYLAIRDVTLEIRDIVCGHDVAAILGIGLGKLFGSKATKFVDGHFVESVLRLSFDDRDLRTMQFWNDLQAWAAKETLGPVFRV